MVLLVKTIDNSNLLNLTKSENDNNQLSSVKRDGVKLLKWGVFVSML